MANDQDSKKLSIPGVKKIQVDAALPSLKVNSGSDYYIEPSGLLVFTEAYHLKRGYCCGSGCRHCPWPKDTP